eukprot:c24004_g1_i2 orf=392-1828(+)
MSAGVNLQSSSTPCICNSQLNISTDCRRISYSATLDSDGRIYSSLKQKTSHYRHLLYIRRKKTSLSPSATLKDTAEKLTVDAPSTESNGSQSLIRSELSALDAYFNKLQGKAQSEQEASPPLDAKSKEDVSGNKPFAAAEGSSITYDLSQDEPSTKNDLKSVELYLERLAKGSNAKQPSSPADLQKSEQELESLIKEIVPSLQLSSVQERMDEELEANANELSSTDNTESFIVYVLAAINIAVYLFGLASPIDTAGMGTSTLPHLYGAKVNELLLSGEWWRLITPMFLHSGFFHVVLSTWALLFFGPQVENVFGPLAFCMIYFLGGLCGNMCSFFFTPAATVGGTGPLFALFSAWVAYLWQNKRVLGEQSADYGIKATTLMGVLVLCLSCLLPTDEWIHVGAILPGVLFGAYASPLLEVGSGMDSNSKNMESREAIFDSPSVLSLTLGFAIFTALCFTVYNIFAPMVAESQLLDSVPF